MLLLFGQASLQVAVPLTVFQKINHVGESLLDVGLQKMKKISKFGGGFVKKHNFLFQDNQRITILSYLWVDVIFDWQTRMVVDYIDLCVISQKVKISLPHLKGIVHSQRQGENEYPWQSQMFGSCWDCLKLYPDSRHAPSCNRV